MVNVVDGLDLYIENSKKGNYHLGRMLWDSISWKPPNNICRIDAGTGETETYGSLRERSLRLAQCFQNAGLVPGDVLAFGGRNHLDTHIPFYAAMLNGMPIVGVDIFYKLDELKSLFMKTKPKIAFCQLESANRYKLAAQELGLDTTVVTYDAGVNSMDKFVEEYYKNEPLSEYKGRTALIISPVQWISAYFNAIGLPVQNKIILQTSKEIDTDHLVDVINQYKPVQVMAFPGFFSSILKSEKYCDLTCFNNIILTGSKVYKSLLDELKSRMRPNAMVIEMYGQTETIGSVFAPNAIPGSCGVPLPNRLVKLIDVDTGKEITEPNAIGELWTNGPRFEEYYGDPEATAACFSPDGWYKTGDLLYRDENNNYYYADRLKTIIKCRGYQIMPPELEELIMSLDGVSAVAVTSIPHSTDCERPVACVVRSAPASVTAEQIKALVAEKLSEQKELSGGVVFLDALPMTPTGKIARAKLRDIVKTAPSEGARID